MPEAGVVFNGVSRLSGMMQLLVQFWREQVCFTLHVVGYGHNREHLHSLHMLLIYYSWKKWIGEG